MRAKLLRRRLLDELDDEKWINSLAILLLLLATHTAFACAATCIGDQTIGIPSPFLQKRSRTLYELFLVSHFYSAGWAARAQNV